jgi:hypothetical protein
MRARHRFGVIAATVGLLGGVGLTAMAGVATVAAASPTGFTCTGSLASFGQLIPPGTYTSLSMPGGSVCFVAPGSVTVNDGITLGEASALLVPDGGALTVNGPVTVGPGAVFSEFDSCSPIKVNGPVSVRDNAVLLICGSTVAGPVEATNATQVRAYFSDISGPLGIQGGGGPNPVLDAFVAFGGPPYGPPDGYNFSEVNESVISGPVSAAGYSGLGVNFVGDVMGPMTFINNTTTYSSAIGSNRINGPATCSGNVPAPNLGGHLAIGSPSIVSGPVRGDQAATCTGVS